jgi:hypothetical protein
MRVEKVLVGDILSIERPGWHKISLKIVNYKRGQIDALELGTNEHVLLDLKTAAKQEPTDDRPIVALLACSKKKADRAAYAADLYRGALFQLSLKYAMDVLDADHIFILSAKHGALSIWELVEPYDMNLGDFVPCERRAWGSVVWEHMHTRLYTCWALQPDKFRWVILAGKTYLEPLVWHFDNHEIAPETPLAGLGIGIQQHRLRQALDQGIVLSELYKVE